MTERSFWPDCQIAVVTATATASALCGFGVVLGWRDYVKIGVLSFLIVLVGLIWTLAYPRLRFPYVRLQEALWKIEQATLIDIDCDGTVGQPEPEQPIIISGAVREPTLFERDLAYFISEFWAGRHSWREWNGKKRGWTRAKLPSGREVEQEYWNKLNQVLLDADIVTRNGVGTLKPRDGVTVGQAQVRAFRVLDSPTLGQKYR